MAILGRKFYIALARALNEAGNVYQPSDHPLDIELHGNKVEEAFAEGKKKGVLVAAEFVADVIQGLEPKFDRVKFMEAVRGVRDVRGKNG